MVSSSISRRRVLWPAAIGVGLALAGTLVVVAFGITNATIARSIPYEWETTVGDQLTQIVDLRSYECRSSPATAALQRLADRLASAASWDRELHVHLINSPLPNAITLPGGHIVVFSALLDVARSGDEVAGVLGHEVGHVVHRHGMQQLTRGLGVALLASLGGGGGSMVSYGGQVWQLTYSREAELEADLFAITILQKIGLRSDGLKHFFENLDTEDKDKSSSLQWLSTHPATPDRIKALDDRTVPGGQAAFTAEQWKLLKVSCQSAKKFDP
ncbi:MAG: M48 family metallopeptidase [Rhodospirillales bacterium]